MTENNNLEEKKFSIAFNVSFNVMYEKDNFVKEVILPNLEKQAMIYFNGNGWFITQLDWENKYYLQGWKKLIKKSTHTPPQILPPSFLT